MADADLAHKLQLLLRETRQCLTGRISN
jgi:hypothetical protein